MRIKNFAVAVLVAIMLTTFWGCATMQHADLKGGEQEIYKSRHTGILPGPDNIISAATAYSIVQKADAEAALLASYGPGGTSSDAEALGFIINDRSSKWNLTIMTKIGRLPIFQSDIPRATKLEHKLRWGEYITIWTNGYTTYTYTLKVMPYADVRTIIKKGEKEEEVKGHWMTHLPR